MNLIDLLFPKKCLECGEGGVYICPNCLKKVRFSKQTTKEEMSVFRHEKIIKKAISELKYKFAFAIAEEIAKDCYPYLKKYKLDKNTVLVPIPLHWQRQNWRGFNQSVLIAEKIAKLMNWKIAPNLLIRTKDTPQQVGLHKSERTKNLSNAFKIIKNNIDLKTPILIFDDVYTTGTTINEAKKTLKNAGFENIKSLTVARG